MFKYIVFSALLAIAFAAPEPEAKPGVLAAPVVAAPVAPVAYSAGYVSPLAYSAHYTAPVYKSAYVAPYTAYSGAYAPVAYSAPFVKYY